MRWNKGFARGLLLALAVTMLPMSTRVLGGEAAPVATKIGPMDLFVTFSRSQLAAAGFARRQAEVRGHRFVWWQKGSGPSLVLVHGVADQAGTWFQVASALAETHRVLLVDLPGHGESGPEDGPLPLTTVVEGFEAWLVRFGLPKVGRPEESGQATLLGNSMGAWVAMLAGQHLPRRVARVVAVNGGGLAAAEDSLSLLPANREEARRLMAALRDPSSVAIPDAVLDDLVLRAKGGDVSRMFEAKKDLESHHLDDHLGKIAIPVDLLWGESDRFLGEAYPKRLLAGLPQSRLTLIPRCGHLPQAECPARFRQQLESVLALPPPGEVGSASDPIPGPSRK